MILKTQTKGGWEWSSSVRSAGKDITLNVPIAHDADGQWADTRRIVFSAGDVVQTGWPDVGSGFQMTHVEAKTVASESKSSAPSIRPLSPIIFGSMTKTVRVGETGFALSALDLSQRVARMCKSALLKYWALLCIYLTVHNQRSEPPKKLLAMSSGPLAGFFFKDLKEKLVSYLLSILTRDLEVACEDRFVLI